MAYVSASERHASPINMALSACAKTPITGRDKAMATAAALRTWTVVGVVGGWIPGVSNLSSILIGLRIAK